MNPAKLGCLLAATACGIVAAACDGGPSSPSSPLPSSPSGPPARSTLSFDKPADAVSMAQSVRWTEAEATFGASIRTTCVIEPTIPTSFCPDLMVRIVVYPPASPTGSDLVCELLMRAAHDEGLHVGRRYEHATSSPSLASPLLLFACPSTCDVEGSFTIFELVANSAGMVERLHTTFERRCNDGGVPGATLTGELWIVNGTRGFID